MQKLIEFNENQETPQYLPSHLEELKHKSEYFEVPDLETKVQTHKNPLYVLQQDILQTKHFQYSFFNNITLTDDTFPQVKIFTQFLLKFFRFNYQFLWELQDQQAYINFPQILTETELLPYIIKNENKHLQYRDPTSLNITFFQQINLDNNCITDYFETSDNRHYFTSHIPPETTSDEQTSNVIPQYTRQHSVQSEEQEDLDNLNLFQNQQSYQIDPLYPQLAQTSDTQQLNPSETVTLQNTSESSEESKQTVQNTQSFTITNDSNLIQDPTHNINPDQTNDPNHNTTFTIIQDNTSLLSTSNTNVTQPSQVQPSLRQNYDQPSIPPQFVTQTHTHNSPQQGSSHTQHTNTVHFQTTTPPSPHEIQTSTYTPAQNTPVQNVQPSLNINTIHSNPPPSSITSRHLSRPPLQPILTNPLSYNLTSTISSNIQQSSTKNTRSNSLNTVPPSQMSNTIRPTLQNSQFQISNPPSTTIRTNPHFHNASTTSITNISNVPTYNTTPPSKIPQSTLSQPTIINSSTSISEPIKPFDGLDHNYTPEEYLQHIEARVIFSSGLQPTLEHEYNFWKRPSYGFYTMFFNRYNSQLVHSFK